MKYCSNVLHDIDLISIFMWILFYIYICFVQIFVYIELVAKQRIFVDFSLIEVRIIA